MLRRRPLRLGVWELNPNGRGILYARVGASSCDDAQLQQQVNALLRFARGQSVTPRLVVAVVGGGTADYEERPDLDLLETEITRGGIRDILVVSSDRISRQPVVCERFFKLLRATTTRLHVEEFGRALSLHRPEQRLALMISSSLHDSQRRISRPHP